jgi:Transposase, Mutator family
MDLVHQLDARTHGLNQALTEQYEAWRERRLLAHYRIIYLDGIHFTVRHGNQTDATMILTALGVDLEGSREVLAFRACAAWSISSESAHECYSQTRVPGGRQRSDGHLEAGDKRSGAAESGCLQSQVSEALSGKRSAASSRMKSIC